MCQDLESQENEPLELIDNDIQLYQTINEQMQEYKMLPIFGIKEAIYYASIFEISGLKLYLDNFPW